MIRSIFPAQQIQGNHILEITLTTAISSKNGGQNSPLPLQDLRSLYLRIQLSSVSAPKAAWRSEASNVNHNTKRARTSATRICHRRPNQQQQHINARGNPRHFLNTIQTCSSWPGRLVTFPSYPSQRLQFKILSLNYDKGPPNMRDFGK